jgi:hypothetical protein
MDSVHAAAPADQPTLRDRIEVAAWNRDHHDIPAPDWVGPFVVRFRPELEGLRNCYGPWAVFAGDGRLWGSYMAEQTAIATAYDLQRDYEQDRWEDYARLPTPEDMRDMHDLPAPLKDDNR